MDCTPIEAQHQLGTVGLLASSPMWGVLVVTQVLLGQVGQTLVPRVGGRSGLLHLDSHTIFHCQIVL